MWKMGASTGPTSGFYSRYKSYCRSASSLDSSMTQENLVLPPTNSNLSHSNDAFGGAGDSGAAVYNEESAAVGLMVRGLVPLN